MYSNSEIKRYIPLVKMISKMFGEKCEVVLHDFSNPQHSIIEIENGNVTGRKIGDSITDFALSVLRKDGYGKKKEDTIVNYRTKTRDGKILKSSTFFIRDNKKEIVGCMCINFDLTEFLMLKKFIEEFCINIDLGKEKIEEGVEVFTSDVNEILNDIIKKAIYKIGKPISLMKKSDKLRVVKTVDEKGGFLIKGAIDELASEICVSRYTIYNYLDELKINKKKVMT